MSPMIAGTPLRFAQAAASGSMSTPTTVAVGTSARKWAAMAPAPVQRSTAVPLAGSRAAARRAHSSVWARGT